MPSHRLHLRSEDLAATVPFGFVADRSGRLTVIGDALARRLGTDYARSVMEVFEVVRPWGVASFLDLPIDPKATVVLRVIGSDIELKGSTMRLDEGEQVAFIGSAVVRDIEEFQQRGLQIGDFPPSDATPDLLLSMQATRSALQDARKLSNNLRVALEDARAAIEAKARFLAMMSHEIRTPLNGFGSMIDLLRDGPLGEEQRQNLDTMDHCAQSLSVLVNDILDFSKLEADRVEIVPEPVAVEPALNRIFDHFRAPARERGLEFRATIDSGGVAWVTMDIERVRQVVANLIGNAVKFTAKGGIEVRVTAPSVGRLAVEVRDSGIGIREDGRDGLFEPFVQADSSITRKFGGTGLGLTISRRLARAMGGDVELVCSDSNGTVFRFWFEAPPCDPVDAPGASRADEQPEAFAGVSILVAEDDSTNRLIAKKMLQKLEVSPTLVGDGLEAIAAAQSRHFDLILMDLMMPNLGGIEAARRIRSESGPCRDVPIIAFSAAAFATDRGTAIEAGMSGFIEKPARLGALRKILRDHLPAPSTVIGGSPSAPPG